MLVACIPTKGRPNTKTYLLFQAVGIPFFHFVEPQDFEAYQATGVPNLINIGENDKGLVFANNSILDYCQANGIEVCCRCDDDMTAFGKAINGRCLVTDATIWLDAYEVFKKQPYEIAAINYRQYAWSEKKPYAVNKTFMQGAFMLKVSKIWWRFDTRFEMKQDRHFTMATIKNGAGVMRFNHLFFSTPELGSNTGGQYERYKNSEDSKAAQDFLLQYPSFSKLVKKGDRTDVKVDIAGYAKSLNKKVI